jgi:fructoselysine-6-P-deglycase FrlB-like protein
VGKPYAAELTSLPDTYAWCLQASVSAFADHIQSYSKFPLLAVGSGGSFTSASFCEYIHQTCTGQLAKAVTPLEAIYSPLDVRHTSFFLLTASGKNSDVIGAFTRLVERKPLSLGALCTRGKSQLAKLASDFHKARVFEFDIPTGKDGYLATNSLLATISYSLEPMRLQGFC